MVVVADAILFDSLVSSEMLLLLVSEDVVPFNYAEAFLILRIYVVFL